MAGLRSHWRCRPSDAFSVYLPTVWDWSPSLGAHSQVAASVTAHAQSYQLLHLDGLGTDELIAFDVFADAADVDGSAGVYSVARRSVSCADLVRLVASAGAHTSPPGAISGLLGAFVCALLAAAALVSRAPCLDI